MKKNDWKKREGVVYSTDPGFAFQYSGGAERGALPPDRQQLRIELDRSGRSGKQVTLVSGFVGAAPDREKLCKHLKTQCGVGGSVKDGNILLQGDMRKKVGDWLAKSGYRIRVI